jgi:hypothetical protein
MAILSNKGRFKSERLPEEELKILQTEIENLSQEEKEALQLILKDMQAPSLRTVKERKLADGSVVTDSGKPLFELFQEAEFERPVVSVEEWLSDSYHMGGAEFRWPKWRNDLIELFSYGYHEMVATGAIGIGKSHPLDTTIALPDGRMIFMGDVEPGMMVVGSKNLPTRVLSVHPQGVRQLYRVIFSDGRTAECCAEHLWNVYTARMFEEKQESIVLPLKDLIDDVAHPMRGRYWVPTASGGSVAIMRVIETKKAESQCITVEAEDGLYTLGNGIITHNSTFVEMALCRLIYEYSCLRDPARTYGLMPGSKIYVLCMNLNADLAKRVVYDKIHERLSSSPYFQHMFKYKYTQTEMRFPKNLMIMPLSMDDNKALGLNVIGGVQSETNFLEGGHRSQDRRNYSRNGRSQQSRVATGRAGNVYEGLITRFKSRFGRVGKLPGLFILDSSKRDQSDWMERHITDVKDDPYVFVRDYNIFDVQPAERFSKQKFRVFVGDEHVGHRILGDNEEVEIDPKSSQQIIEIPENWRDQFEKDLDTAIRNIAGIATVSIDRLFGSGTAIANAMEVGEKLGNPFQSDIVVTDQKLIVNWAKIAGHKEGSWVLNFDPKVDHAVHMDMGYRRDRFGIACGYIAGEKQVERLIGTEVVIEKMPIIAIRWMIALQAPRDREVQLSMGRSLVWQSMQYGHRIRYGSCDSYQSVETLQKFEAKGIDAKTLSVESEDSYLALRDAFNDGRIICPHSELLMYELTHLEHDKRAGRVDHPEHGMGVNGVGSKDLADAVCGVVMRLTDLYLSNDLRSPAPMSLGFSEFEENEEVEEQDFWVLDKGVRPVQRGEMAASMALPGANKVGGEGRKPPPFLIK